MLGFAIFASLMAIVGFAMFYIRDKELTELRYGLPKWYKDKQRFMTDLVLARSQTTSVSEQTRSQVTEAVNVLLGDLHRARAEQDAESLCRVLRSAVQDIELPDAYQPHLLQVMADSWNWPSTCGALPELSEALTEARKQLESAERLAVLDAMRGMVKLLHKNDGTPT